MRRLTYFLAVVALCIIAVKPVVATAASSGSVACDGLSASLSPDKNYYEFTATASGDPATITGYTFAFGDHQSYSVDFGQSAQSRLTAVVTHTYEKAGSYAANVQVSADVNGKPSQTTSDVCHTTITIAPPVKTDPLPNSGPGDTTVIFVAAAFMGFAAYQCKLRRAKS